MSPRFTIITPCLNAESTIRDTVESVINQNIDDLEYIIIDGGSTDRTLNILKEYGRYINILISEPDDGISDAFNKGIKLASGDYIGIINADDFYEPQILKHISDLAQKGRPPDIIHGKLQYHSPSGHSYIEEPNLNKIWDYMTIFHPTMFIHYQTYKKIGTYRLDFHYAMDSEWVHRAVKSKASFAQSPRVISNMRLGGHSHKNLYKSLREFRHSAIMHGGSKLTTTFFLYRQLAIQSLIKVDIVKQLLLWLRQIKSR